MEGSEAGPFKTGLDTEENNEIALLSAHAAAWARLVCLTQTARCTAPTAGSKLSLYVFPQDQGFAGSSFSLTKERIQCICEGRSPSNALVYTNARSTTHTQLQVAISVNVRILTAKRLRMPFLACIATGSLTRQADDMTCATLPLCLIPRHITQFTPSWQTQSTANCATGAGNGATLAVQHVKSPHS